MSLRAHFAFTHRRLGDASFEEGLKPCEQPIISRGTTFCLKADIASCVKLAMRVDAHAVGRFGAYELHDLVVLDQHTVGVIVEISKEACKVCFALRGHL